MSTDNPFDTGKDDVVFTSAEGNVWFLTGKGGPDLAAMDERDRAILRALLMLAMSRLDRAENPLPALTYPRSEAEVRGDV
jgi:hypothetical protein